MQDPVFSLVLYYEIIPKSGSDFLTSVHKNDPVWVLRTPHEQASLFIRHFHRPRMGGVGCSQHSSEVTATFCSRL